MKLTEPPTPKKGDVAYVISPSAGIIPFVPNRTQRAKNYLEGLGFKVVMSDHASESNGYVSASVQDRVADIHAAFKDPECTLVIASIGGNHANQLLTHIDYALIASNPKVFVGYSDNTVLHLALATQSGLQTFYGPCLLNQFGEYPEPLPYTVTHFKDAVMNKKAKVIAPSAQYTDEILDWFKNKDTTRPRNLVANEGVVWWKGGTASGWALPGAIPSLNHVVGTIYFPNPQGAILMIDIPEGHSMHEGLSVADVDSWLTDLDNVGVLAKIKGMVIGRPYKYSAEMTEKLREVILKITKGYNYPILFNVDFGHTDPMITIPYGAEVRLESKHSRLSLR